MRKYLITFLVFFCGVQFSFAQTQREYSSVQIYKKIEKLNFLGSVLYVAAHPDDENTALISYLSNKVNARVGYLAMTRGDGGQNLLGPEIRAQLGVIRTEELLAARRIDGGIQLFTRANDFGYSKNPEETFRIWDKQKVLSDVVWAFRKFRPDIIVNRFDHRIEGHTHGHHTASARLSVEAFDLSGKADKFPGQLKYYKPWQPKRLYYNQSWFRYGSKKAFAKVDKSGFLKIDLGPYLPVLGESNTEISARSRSQNKTQGFGVSGTRGTDFNYFEPIKGDLTNADKNLFAGINTTWTRIKGGKEIGKILTKVQKNFEFFDPARSIPGLLKAYQLIKKLDNPHWRKIKTKEIKNIIAACAGLYLEPSSPEEFGTLGETLKVNVEAINRSKVDINLNSVSVANTGGKRFTFGKELDNNIDFQEKENLTIPTDLHYTSPYWLRYPHTIGMYTVKKQQLIGLPETPPQLVFTFHTRIDGVPIDFTRNLIYKTASLTKGEVREPFDIVPDVSVGTQDKTIVFAGDSSQKVKVDVKAYKDSISGILRLKHAKGWKVKHQKINLKIDQKGKSKTFVFTVTPPDSEDQAEVQPEFTFDVRKFTKHLNVISYPHIRTQTVLLPAKTHVIRLNIKTGGKNIAYIKGAGDDVPQALQQIGYHVSFVSSKDLSAKKLQKYDAVVLGIRAYDVDENLVLNQSALFNYVKNGGTLITQYTTIAGLKTDKIAPYKLHLSHNRVTDENSDVKFLAPNNPVLNTPNKITKKDFNGWVQERGLYFPDKWSDKFTPILGMHDKGEKELKSSMLVAKYGKGYYVYTGLSFFRELPAGVPGAYRLFANLLALGNGK